MPPQTAKKKRANALPRDKVFQEARQQAGGQIDNESTSHFIEAAGQLIPKVS